MGGKATKPIRYEWVLVQDLKREKTVGEHRGICSWTTDNDAEQLNRRGESPFAAQWLRGYSGVRYSYRLVVINPADEAQCVPVLLSEKCESLTYAHEAAWAATRYLRSMGATTKRQMYDAVVEPANRKYPPPPASGVGVPVYTPMLRPVSAWSDIHYHSVADVIVVHGLGGSPETTFASTASASASNPSCWPAEFLLGNDSNVSIEWHTRAAHDKIDGVPPVHSVRMLTVSHNLDFNPANGAVTVDQETKRLLESARLAQVGERPIVWICHSMGGILVKNALKVAASRPELASIVHRTAGIVFYGTPHHGADSANTLRTVGLLGNQQSLVYLNARENPELAVIHAFFLEQRGIEYFNFKETLPRSLLNGAFQGMVVKDLEADLPDVAELPNTPIHRSIPAVDKDHISICKFTSRENALQNRTYLEARRCVATWLARARNTVVPMQGGGGVLELLPRFRTSDAFVTECTRQALLLVKVLRELSQSSDVRSTAALFQSASTLMGGSETAKVAVFESVIADILRLILVAGVPALVLLLTGLGASMAGGSVLVASLVSLGPLVLVPAAVAGGGFVMAGVYFGKDSLDRLWTVRPLLGKLFQYTESTVVPLLRAIQNDGSSTTVQRNARAQKLLDDMVDTVLTVVLRCNTFEEMTQTLDNFQKLQESRTMANAAILLQYARRVLAAIEVARPASEETITAAAVQTAVAQVRAEASILESLVTR